MRARSEGTSEWVRGIVAGLAVVLALAAVGAAEEQPAAAQSATAAEQPTGAKTAEQPKGGMGEGVKVHGQWTIDIKNPDGSVASHHRFENALVGGQALLAGVLAHYFSDHTWQVHLFASDDLPCGRPHIAPFVGIPYTECIIAEGRSTLADGENVSRNLILNLPTGGNRLPVGTLELSGSTTAKRSFSLISVQSRFRFQLSDGFGSTDSSNHNSEQFTGTNLANPIPVAGGQIIQVTVIFSFS